jgi:D-inositol-3-phosphate glycosyltransferase
MKMDKGGLGRATISIALLTGGGDKPYALGLASALAAGGVAIDFIGSDELDCPQVRSIPRLTFLNARGNQSENAPYSVKIARILTYYGRLLRYAATRGTPILHILWNNKFELFDRTALMLYYRIVGKRVVLTAHNVNAAARDRKDTWVNRASLRTQYRLCDHVFVHTAAMKRQLVTEFGVAERRVTVIPFGINDTIPKTGLTSEGARRRLGLPEGERVLLFFGRIGPYKGLEYLIEALATISKDGECARLIIAGKVKRGSEAYWRGVQASISRSGLDPLVIQRIEFIPDDEVEVYFKAADAVVIPYVDIFQSGVPFLAFSFGLPVIATDVGSLREDVTRDTGLLCRPCDPADLARAIREFYGSGLRRDPAAAAVRIRQLATERHSWGIVADRTEAVYAGLLPRRGRTTVRHTVPEQRPGEPSRCPE